MTQEKRKKGQIIIFKTKNQTTRFPLKTGTYKLPITIKNVSRIKQTIYLL